MNFGSNSFYTIFRTLSNGGGIYSYSYSFNLTNSIVASNEGNYGLYVSPYCTGITSYCDFFDNENGNFFNAGYVGINVLTNANGDSCDAYMNIQLDPCFTDTANGDFWLTANSPCIDAGNPTSPFDPDGTIADMGAYFFDQTPYFPIADFSGDVTTGNVPLTVQFTDQSTPGLSGNQIIEWQWDFDNDGTIDSNDQNPSYTYQLPGTYSVALTVSDGNLQNTEIKNDYITVTGNLVDGYAFLSGQTNHDNIKVNFERSAPSTYSDSVYTDSTGYYLIGLPSGMYNVHFSHDGFFNQDLENQTIFANITLNDVQLDIHTSTLNVPSVYSSIQLALDIALEGDTILVEAGIYHENLIWPQTNGLKLLGSGKEDCIIDGSNFSNVIIFDMMDSMIIDSTTVIKNFTLQNGHANGTMDDGGALHFHHYASPKFENLIIQNNIADGDGGGIWCRDSCSPVFDNIVLSNNSAQNGGGAYCHLYSCPVFRNSEIINNIAYCGGGVSSWYLGSPVLNNVEISGNQAEYGGGIDCRTYCIPEITHSLIINNFASIQGGGICIRDDAGVYIYNSTISDNTTNGNGAGIFYQYYPDYDGTIQNSIISNNSGNYGLYVLGDFPPSITYSNFFDNEIGNFFNTGQWIGVNVGVNAKGDSCDVWFNIQEDPLYADTSSCDFTLSYSSPCIDAGDPSPPYDPDFTISDIGAKFYDQRQPHADFISDLNQGYSQIQVTFLDQSTIGIMGYPITDWAWDFDNDGTIDSNDQNPQFTYYDRGFYTVSLTISDLNYQDTETKSNYIEVLNSSPIVQNPLSDISFDEDTSNSSIDLNNVFDDADLSYGDSLSYSFSGNTEIQIDLVDGVVTLTPNPNWFGTESITFTATDDTGVSIDDIVQVEVLPVNDPPILNITGTFETDEDLPSQTNDFTTYCTQTWGENDTLVLTADNSTHIDVTISGFDVTFESNTDNWNGTEDIIFYLDDNVTDTISRLPLSDTRQHKSKRINRGENSRDIVQQTISVTVNPVNDPPILNITGTFEADEDLPSQTYDFSQYCSQTWGENDNLVLTANNSAHIDVTINGFDVIFESNTPNWFGSGNITFYLDDGITVRSRTRDIVEQTIQVAVNPLNDPPILNITGSLEADEDLPSQTYDFSQFCSQTWGETDVLSLTSTNSTHIDVTITDFDVVFQSNTLNWNGTEDITFYLDDNVSTSSRDIVEQSVPVTILPVNDPPSITLPDDFTFDEDGSLIEDFTNYVSDIEPDNLTLSFTGNISVLININDLEVSFSSVDDWFGSEMITFIVDDNVTDLTAEDSVLVSVNPLNDPPILDIVGTFEADEDLPSQTYDFSQFCSQTWGETDVLTLTATNSTHIDVTITDFDVTFESNTPNWFGTEDITFYLDDNVTTRNRDVVEQTIPVIVNPVNDPPSIVLPDDFEFAEDGELVVDFSNYISDIDDDDLTLSVLNNVNVLVDIVDAEVTFSALENWFGDEILTFVIDDNVTELTAEDSVIVNVTPVNDPPELISFTPEDLIFSVVQDSVVNFDVVAEDIDSDLEYEWYVDDIVQAEITSTFEHQFSNIGSIEIKSIITDTEYDIETNWEVTVEPGSGSGNIIVTQTALYDCYPNPFNPETTIRFDIKNGDTATLQIFNIKGQVVLTKQFESGQHQYRWNASKHASGLYLYRLQTDSFKEMKKMIMLK